MKRVLLAGVGLLALSFAGQPSFAADMPRPVTKAPIMVAAPMFNWTGFYVGGTVGYGWGRSTIHDIDDFCLGAGTCPTPHVNYDFNGAVGGVLAGYNWQSGNLVFGAELDFSASGMDGVRIYRPPGPARLETDIDWFGTGRLRIGYAADRALVYLAGGFAYADVENRMTSGSSSARSSEAKWGWTAGAGWEYALPQAWTFRLEYLFIDLEDGRGSVAPPSTGRFEWENRFHVVRAGLSYKFASGKAPLAAPAVVTKY